jgi:predicted GH43/DUF377 family glycosyl hydrolase
MKKILAYLFVVTAFAMQANGQVKWTKYPGNPVFPRNPDDRYFDSQIATNPHVIYDGNIYHMWYTGYDGGSGGAKTGYAYSTDGGINWTRNTNPVLEGGAPGSWDAVTTFQPSVLKDDTTYHMWYCGHDGSLDHRQIGYATGSDSIHWSKYGSNPLLTPGPPRSWDDLFVESPEVLFIDGIYHMWYSGADDMYWQIGHATSLDGITWVKDTLNPVVRVGKPGSWDEQNVIQPSVVFDGTIYHMWYSGGVTPGWDWKTGYAYSLDGRNWVKVSVNNPVMGLGDPGSWDDTFAGVCSVIFDENESTFKMWYGGGNGIVVGDIGYATAPKASFDFENNPFIKYDDPTTIPAPYAESDPVLLKGPGGEWNSVIIENPYVLFDGSVYHMWYAGSDGTGLRIGYAHSSDGINWVQYDDPTTTTSPYANSDPVLNNGSTGSWDEFHVLQPSVIFDGTSYHMWFGGIGNSSFTDRHIGYATSPDTIHWTEPNGNPVVPTGPPGSWDDEWVDSPNVLFINGVYHMWYCGFDGTYVQTGHATSLDGITWDKDTLNPVLKVGAPESWDGFWTYQPSVLFDGKVYHMFYSGSSASGAFQWMTGYAYSFDGSNWIKYDDPTTTTLLYAESDPVLSTGLSRAWDDTYAGQSSVIFNNNFSGSITGFKMWYGGGNGIGTGDIGFASTDIFPPAVPTGLKAFYIDSIPANKLSWDENTEEDFSYYTIYRSTSNTSYEKIGQVSNSFFLDSTLMTGSMYAVSATDNLGNESAKSDPVVTGLSETSEVPIKYYLSSNYPNPFNPATKIRYQIANAGMVSLQVYNLLGEVVATLVNEEKPVGTYELTWNAENLSSGVYFYRLQAGNFIETKKMLLLK